MCFMDISSQTSSIYNNNGHNVVLRKRCKWHSTIASILAASQIPASREWMERTRTIIQQTTTDSHCRSKVEMICTVSLNVFDH
jgi:hypothetical protein